METDRKEIIDFDKRDVKFIYRTSIKLKNGKTIYAKNYGIKAFKIPIE